MLFKAKKFKTNLPKTPTTELNVELRTTHSSTAVIKCNPCSVQQLYVRVALFGLKNMLLFTHAVRKFMYITSNSVNDDEMQRGSYKLE